MKKKQKNNIMLLVIIIISGLVITAFLGYRVLNTSSNNPQTKSITKTASLRSTKISSMKNIKECVSNRINHDEDYLTCKAIVNSNKSLCHSINGPEMEYCIEQVTISEVLTKNDVEECSKFSSRQDRKLCRAIIKKQADKCNSFRGENQGICKALIYDNPKECNSVDKTNDCKDFYYFSKAVLNKNPDECKKINYFYTRFNCLALITKNLSYCNTELIDNCRVMEILMKANLSHKECNTLLGEENREICNRNVDINIIEQSDNKKSCNNIENSELKKACNSIINNDINECLAIQNESAKMTCIIYFLEKNNEKNNKSLCDYLKTYREECLEYASEI